MSQQRIQDYGSPVVAASLKLLVESITTPGILSGNEFVLDVNNRMRINPGSCVTQQGVIITEDEIKYLTIDVSKAADYTVYYSHEDVQISGGEAAELTIQAGLLTQDVISGCILGYIRYPGGGIPLAQTHFIQPPPLKIGTVTPTIENATWLTPIKSMGYVITYTSGATINITDGGLETFTPLSLTGTVTNGSKIVSAITPSTLNILKGWTLSGNYIPINTTVNSIDTINQLTITNAATGTGNISLVASAPKPMLYMKLRNNNSLSSGTVILTFPFKVSELPYSLLQMILSTDNSVLVTPLFIDSIGNITTLGIGFSGQSEFLLKTEAIPQTTYQEPNTIVYLQLQIYIPVGREVRIQALGLNTYNLPV